MITIDIWSKYQSIHYWDHCLCFCKTFDGLARILFAVVVSVVNLKSVLNCGDLPVKLLLSSAINIWWRLLNQGVKIHSAYAFAARLMLFTREAMGGLYRINNTP